MVEDLTDYQRRNREKIIEKLRGGAKTTQKLGLELEHILLHEGTNAPVSYNEFGGVRDILEKLAPGYDHAIYEGDNIIGLVRECEVITIEPAGQLEISSGPFDNIVDAERVYLGFRDRLDPILDEFGIITPMLGYNPSVPAGDLELVPKFRYQCMSRYLGAQAYEGICMMRGTAAYQVSIDFESEADALRKFRIAQIIGPILALISDNAPVFEGEERRLNMVRTAVWSGFDWDRSGVVPGSLDKGFSFADYADYIMTRPAIVVPPDEGEAAWRYVADQTFDELYADRLMTDEEAEHALSMVWPDVRLKNFIEIRPADAMPFEYCLAYTVLIRALFYSNRNLGVLDSLLSEVTETDVRAAKAALMEKGYGATVYGRPVEFWADLLIVLASGSLEEGEGAYLEPIASMVQHRFTLAEIWPRLMEKRNQMPAGTRDAPVIGVVPRYDFEWTGLAISDGYLSGLLEMGAVPIVLPLTDDPQHIERIVATCSGFLIPGGQDIDPAVYGARREPHTHRSATSRDAMEQALIRAVIAADKPLLGICRGMQSMNVALGGTLCQDIAEVHPETGFQHVQGRPFDMPAHMVEVHEDSRLFSYVGAPRLGVNTIHHQSVDKLGERLVVSAVSPDDGVIEGIEIPDARFVIGVQWHPEYMWRTRPHSKRLFRALVQAAAQYDREKR